MEVAGDITGLISEWQQGNKDAENELFDILYRSLRGIALNCLRSENHAQSMSPTVLVHEAYIRLTNSDNLEVSNRGHFLALAARVMRRIIVDRARARRATKRDGEAYVPGPFDLIFCTEADPDQILAVDRALDELTVVSKRQAHLIELRYFAGYSFEECAAALEISPRTTRREWQIARTRLRIAINGTRRS